MLTHNKLQKDYTLNQSGYQLKLPLGWSKIIVSLEIKENPFEIGFRLLIIPILQSLYLIVKIFCIWMHLSLSRSIVL